MAHSHPSARVGRGGPALVGISGLPARTAASAGVIFDGHGQGWLLGDVRRAEQDWFSSDIDWSEKLPTYSWRRVGPSLG